MVVSASPPPFDTARFQALLRTEFVGRRIDCHATTPSTMTLADERVRSEGAAAAHGSIILAETQTGGIGRRGRSWLSPPTGNLYFSLLWAPLLATAASSSTAADPTVLLPHLSQLNLAASVAVVKAAAAVAFLPRRSSRTTCGRPCHRHRCHRRRPLKCPRR